jgi:hypothetical protein
MDVSQQNNIIEKEEYMASYRDFSEKESPYKKKSEPDSRKEIRLPYVTDSGSIFIFVFSPALISSYSDVIFPLRGEA